MSIFNDGASVNVQVNANIVHDPDHPKGGHSYCYDVEVYDLNGIKEQAISGFNLYHDVAYTLMKMAGVPWRDALLVLQYAEIQAEQKAVQS